MYNQGEDYKIQYLRGLAHNCSNDWGRVITLPSNHPILHVASYSIGLNKIEINPIPVGSLVFIALKPNT